VTRAVTAAKKHPGVSDARLEGTDRLIVTYDPQRTSVAEIATNVELLSGYRAEPIH
jgi:hypothetical protein